MRVNAVVKICALTFVLGLYGCETKHALSGYYPQIRIGPGNTVTVAGKRSLQEPRQLSFFNYFRGAYIASADHMLRSSTGAPAYRALYLETSLKGDKLDRTVKTTALLRGEFGSIFLRKTCFYNRPGDTFDTLAIGRFDDDEGAGPAEQVSTPLERLGEPTSFALLRVYRDGLGSAVVTGNYEANGKLQSLHIDHTRSGARLFYPEDGVKTFQGQHMAHIPTPVGVGLPLTLGKDFNASTLRLPVAPLPVMVEVFFTSYDDGKLVREDFLAPGRRTPRLVETHYLRPSIVDEQRQLDPACDAQLAKQRAASSGTLE